MMARAERPRMPKNLTGQLASLISETAVTLRGDGKDASYRRGGLANAQIVTAALPQAREIVGEHIDALTAEFLSGLVPKVLGDGIQPPRVVEPAMIPGLHLPMWMPCLPSEEEGGAAGWKRDRDMTPHELDRLIEHRLEIIRGHQIERQKLVLLRETAVELGCDMDDPVSTVFPDATPTRPRPDDRPTA